MKLKSFLALAMACMFMSSCALLGMGGATASGSANGQASGAALKSLYSQYKTDGKVDMGNLTNIMNIVALTNGIQGLKGLDDKSAFYSDFATGLILGSNNLVTQQTAKPVTNTLGSLASTDLSGILSTAAAVSALTQATQQGGQKQQQQQVIQAAQQPVQSTSQVASALSSINETTTGVSNVISSLGTIFGMFQ